jgi:hypothetical protein
MQVLKHTGSIYALIGVEYRPQGYYHVIDKRTI